MTISSQLTHKSYNMDKQAIKQDIINELKKEAFTHTIEPPEGLDKQPIYSLCDSIRSVYDELDNWEDDGESHEYLSDLLSKVQGFTKAREYHKRHYLYPEGNQYHNKDYWFCWPLDDLTSRIKWLDDNM